jgi:hypothetical protein
MDRSAIRRTKSVPDSITAFTKGLGAERSLWPHFSPASPIFPAWVGTPGFGQLGLIVQGTNLRANLGAPQNVILPVLGARR